jgi:hypothetical protein
VTKNKNNKRRKGRGHVFLFCSKFKGVDCGFITQREGGNGLLWCMNIIGVFDEGRSSSSVVDRTMGGGKGRKKRGERENEREEAQTSGSGRRRVSSPVWLGITNIERRIEMIGDELC